MVEQAIFAFLFGGMLIAGTLIVLLSPVIFKLTQEVTSWKLYGLLALVLAVMGVSLYVVYLALTEPLFFLPFVVLVVGLRASSPTILFKSLQERFEVSRFWTPLKVLLAVGFLGYAGYLIYTLVLDLLEPLIGPQSQAALLSEQLLMALGGAFVIIRVFAKVLPESLRDKPTAWIAAILLSVAFAVMAPFAFPGFDVAYKAAGLGGWLLGLLVIWRFS